MVTETRDKGLLRPFEEPNQRDSSEEAQAGETPERNGVESDPMYTGEPKQVWRKLSREDLDMIAAQVRATPPHSPPNPPPEEPEQTDPSEETQEKYRVESDPRYIGESQTHWQPLSPEATSRVLSAVANDQQRERLKRPDDSESAQTRGSMANGGGWATMKSKLLMILLVGALLIVAAFVYGGVYEVKGAGGGASACYVVNRFTGKTWYVAPARKWVVDEREAPMDRRR